MRNATLLIVLGLAVACSSSAAEQVCGRLDECNFLQAGNSAAECATELVDAVDDGRIEAHDVDRCADCLASNSCSEIAMGDCAVACTGAMGGGDDDPDPGPSPGADAGPTGGGGSLAWEEPAERLCDRIEVCYGVDPAVCLAQLEDGIGESMLSPEQAADALARCADCWESTSCEALTSDTSACAAACDEGL